MSEMWLLFLETNENLMEEIEVDEKT
jgi:hypothetical protein